MPPIALLALLASFPGAATAGSYAGSSFAEVRAAVFADPYPSLPRIAVEASALGPPGESPHNRLRAAARRTLTVRDDLVEFPGGRKLFQANGRCFTGEWRVSEASPFSGFFAKGSRALLIVRASVALSQTTRGHRRAFAMAGKIFPTLDPDEVVRTENFFAMENLLGTDDDHFLDAVLDNEPVASGLPGGIGELLLGLRIRADLAAADRAVSPGGPDVGYRPVRSIAELGVPAGAPVVAPRWLRLRIAQGTPRVDAADFRDELALGRYPGKRLRWDVLVAAPHPEGKASAEWHRIGAIVLEDDVVSRGCDARLHFAHPRIR